MLSLSICPNTHIYNRLGKLSSSLLTRGGLLLEMIFKTGMLLKGTF